MKDSDIPFWRIIEGILEKHSYPNYAQGCIINFKSNTCDYHDFLREAKLKKEEEEGIYLFS